MGVLSEELGKFMRIINLGTFQVYMNPNQSSIKLVSPNIVSFSGIGRKVRIELHWKLSNPASDREIEIELE